MIQLRRLPGGPVVRGSDLSPALTGSVAATKRETSRAGER